MIFKNIEIPISNLKLWDENARFPDQYYNSDESELIKYFLQNPNFKIIELIEEIVQDFDLPQLEKIVVWKDNEDYIVLEGNRRLTGYKLLAEPAICKEIDPKLFEYISDIKSSIKIDIDFSLECVISENKEQCFRFIDRKHSKGNNQVNWLEPERVNYANRRGKESQNAIIKNAITNYTRKLDLPQNIIDEILGKGFVTNYYRLVSTGPAKELFGLSTNEKGELTYQDDDFPNILKIIIHNVLKKKDFQGNPVDSRALNRNPEIKNYLESIDSKDAQKVDVEITSSTTADLFGNERIKLSNTDSNKSSQYPRKTPRTKENNILFGKTLSLEAGKVNDLYRAILSIYEKNHDDPNILPIIGMSMRLITEVAARVYFDRNDPAKSSNDQLYNSFLKIAKSEMSLEKDTNNFLSLTSNWLDGKDNLEGVLAKYAHGSILTTKEGVLGSSFIIGEILEYYFKKQ